MPNQQHTNDGTHSYPGADGPTSSAGVEARDLPDGGRGPMETDPGKEAKRTLPQQSGAIENAGGTRASLDASDADRHGGRKHN